YHKSLVSQIDYNTRKKEGEGVEKFIGPSILIREKLINIHDLQQMVLHCLTDDVKSGSWIEIRVYKIKRIVVIAISSFGANLFDISDNKKEMDNHEIKDKLAVFPKIFGLGCVINSQFNKLEQFLTVDLTNGNIKGRLVKSFQNTRETEKPVKLLLRGDIMPFY
ncbi:13899_t:CDS:2, partial [Entrophospora sp. SA101]